MGMQLHSFLDGDSNRNVIQYLQLFVSMEGNISLDVSALGGKLPTQTQVLLL